MSSKINFRYEDPKDKGPGLGVLIYRKFLIFVPKIKILVRKCVVVRLFGLVCMYNVDARCGFGCWLGLVLVMVTVWVRVSLRVRVEVRSESDHGYSLGLGC